jgi:hypothetical protein
MVTVCFTNFSYLTGDCLGTALFGDNCFVFVFGLVWVWVWLGCLTAAKKASADFRGEEKVGDGSPGS